MLSLTASLTLTVTTIAVVVFSAALLLLSLEYRGEEFVGWMRRNGSPMTIAAGGGVVLIASLTLSATFVGPPAIAWTLSAVIVFATLLGALGLEYRREASARRPAHSPLVLADASKVRSSALPTGARSDRLPPATTGFGHDGGLSAYRLPPASVRTVQDLIYWQHAKASSGSSGAIALDRFEKLRAGEIPWGVPRQSVEGPEEPDRCLFCGEGGPLTRDHMISGLRGEPLDGKNTVWLCSSCSSSKGPRTPYQYWSERRDGRAAEYGVPRVAEARYLELLQELLAPEGVLAWRERDLRKRVCPSCRLRSVCRAHGTEGKLSPVCLDAVVGVVVGG